MSAPLRFRLARQMLRLILGTLFRVELRGRDRLPGGRAYVLACNHLSWADPFLLLGWLPPSPRIHFLGRRSAIYNRRWKRWVLELMGGVIPVESGDIDHLSQAVEFAVDVIDIAQDDPELVAPEARHRVVRARLG